MIYQIYAIAVKELKILLRDPNGLVALFALPLVFITVMTFAQSSAFDVITGDDPLEVLMVNQDQGHLATQAIKDLYQADNITPIEEINGQAPTLEMANQLVADSHYALAVVFPPNFTERVLAAATQANPQDAVITFIADPAASLQITIGSQNTIKGYVQGSITYAQIPEQVEVNFDGLIANLPTLLNPFFQQEVGDTVQNTINQIPPQVQTISDDLLTSLPTQLDNYLDEAGISTPPTESDIDFSTDPEQNGLRFQRTFPSAYANVNQSTLANNTNTPIPIAIVNQDTGELSQQIINGLQNNQYLSLITSFNNQPLNQDSAEQVVLGGAFLAIIFPPNFSTQILQATIDEQVTPSTITYLINPTANPIAMAAAEAIIGQQIQSNLLQAQVPHQIRHNIQTTINQLPQEINPFLETTVNNLADDIEEQVSGQVNDLSDTLLSQLPPKVVPFFNTQIRSDFLADVNNDLPSSFNIDNSNDGLSFTEVAPAGLKVEKRPNSVQQNVPAWTIFGIFFIVQTLGTGLLRERLSGTFKRLLGAPISKFTLLIGTILPYYLISFIQVALMFAIGVFVFGLQLGNNFLALLPISFAVSSVALSLGVLVAALGKTSEQVNGMALILMIPLAAAGGIMVSRIFMPEFMQKITHFTPHAWALDGYHDVIVRGLGVQATFNEIVILLAIALFVFSLALWRFKFE